MPNTVTNEKIISATYVALFQRSPDQAGFKYWSDKAAELQLAGKTGNDLAKEMANLFALHPAFTSLYGTLGDAAYIDAIYTNIGGKVADANGRAFWLGKLTDATNPLSRAELVGEFVYTILSITPAELQAQKDAGSITAQELTDALARQDRLNNKSDVALKFTQAMGVGSNLSPGTDPNSLESLQQDPVYLASKAIINGVTEDDATMTAPNTYLNGTPTITGINETFGGGVGGKTFMLTAGVDNFSPTASGANKTTDGNDTIEGTGTTLTSLDTIDGGKGYDTLVIRDPAGVMGTTAPAGVTIAVEKVDINTAGALGNVNASGQAAQKQIDKLTFTVNVPASTATLDVTYGGVTLTTAALDGTVTQAEVNTLVANTINAIAGSTVATVVGADVIVTAPTAGTALPTINVVDSNTGDVSFVNNNQQPNQEAVAGSTVAIYDLSGVTGLETVVAKAAGNVNVKLADTSDVSITTTTGSVTVAGGKAVTTSGATGAVAVTGAAGLTSVDVTGATTVTIADNGTEADTLATVSISGATGTSTISSDALTKLTVANSNQNVTVTAAAATRALDLTVNKLTGGTIQDAAATTLTVTATGSDSSVTALSAAAATTVNFAGDKKLVSAGETFTAATSITSTNSAGITLGTALGTAVSFTGGAGDDTIEIGATTKAINMGEGKNTVKITSSVTTIGAGGTVAAGAGTEDTLSMAAADAATATADATAKAAFADKISGFERLTLGATTTSAEVKLNNLNNINYVSVGDVANSQTLTLSGVASGFTLNANSGTTGNGAVAVALATDGAVGVVDVLNVGISNSTPQDLQALTANKFETINFASDDTATTPAGGFLHIVSALSADAVKTINVTGDAGFNLGYTGTTATTVDASGITKGGFTWTAGTLAASSVVKGSATGTNTINLDSATTASTFVTYTGGSGNDVVDASSSNNNNVFSLLGGDNNLQSGNGNNTVTLASDKAVAVANGATGNKIVLGNGTNTVTDTGTKGAYVEVGTGANTITLGSGNDFVKVGAAAGLNVINVGSGTDTVVMGGIQTAAGYYTSITGFGAGDVLNLADLTTGASTDAALGAKITLGPLSGFAQYLDAATAGDGGTNAIIKWFQLAGNTYVVVDNDAALTFQDGKDSVIELVGLIDLSTSATVSDVLTLA